MRRHLLLLSIPVLLVAAACGPRARAAESAARKRLADGPPIVSSFDVRTEESVRFALHVTNNVGKRVEVTFPNGLTHDIVVLDAVGREVWRWSAGRMFTQTLQNRILDASETISYDAEWRPEAAHGAFVAVASLHSENYPIEQRVHFVLP